ncbi:Uncharacterised protein [Mycobacteroides abscessus subsp. abscessus]|nr:Uncharacterised protein [Mycobacteroides abscessus subsp. abscessus]
MADIAAFCSSNVSTRRRDALPTCPVARSTGRPCTYSTTRLAAAASAASVRRAPAPLICWMRRTNTTANGSEAASTRPSRQSTARMSTPITAGTVTI